MIPPSNPPPSFHPPPSYGPYSSAYPNAGYYPAQPPAPPPEPRRTSPVVWVLAAMGLMAVLGGLLGTCGLVGGLVALGASSEGGQGGVVLGKDVTEQTVSTLRERKLLGPREEILAYNDATVSLDMSDVTFVSATRVVHAHDKVVNTIELADVKKITHRSQGMIGEGIDLVADDGTAMHIQIAPLNNGESYVDVLEGAWEKRRPGSKITHAKP